MFLMHSDPMYLVLMVVGVVLAFLPQQWVKSTFNRYAEVPTDGRLSGRETALRILGEHGLDSVAVERSEGTLSDHYDPGARAVRLSPDVYDGRSIASVAVAAHECGHAIQHAKGFFPVVIRSTLAPVFGLGSTLGPWLIILAIGLGASRHLMPDWALTIAWAGVVLYGLAVAFQVITLPVELDASGRALKVLAGHQYLNASEMPGARKVLTAAAFTYVAAALYALMELMYWVFQLLNSLRRNN